MATTTITPTPQILSIQKILADVRSQNGTAKTENFTSIRAVQAKMRELRIVLSEMGSVGIHVAQTMEQDEDMRRTDSRRVLLEGIATYCDMALRFVETGLNPSAQKSLTPLPTIEGLVGHMPLLGASIQRRWVEAQKNHQNECYTSSVIMMGSILEALLLSRASLSPDIANRSTKVPKLKDGRAIAVHDWTLNSLIDVAVEVGWLKVDRGKFGHALRESRNIVHPWAEVAAQADFDDDTCKTSWQVLTASINDLLRSL